MPTNNYDPYEKGYYVPEEIGTGKYKPWQGGRREQVWGGIMGTNPNVDNPFKNMDYFKYGDMSGIADSLASLQRERAIRTGNKRKSDMTTDVGERLASAGISPGNSYYDTSVERAEDRANADTVGQLGDIDMGRMAQTLPMMQADNEMGFNVASAGSNLDLANLANTLKRLGLLQGMNEGWEASDAGNEFDWGGLMGSLIGGGAQVGSAALLASDRRFKQNIEQVDVSEEGIPIVEFSYKNNPDKRYRGVIAQDVEEIIPEAVVEQNGMKYVDYNKLSVNMMEV